MNTSAVLSPCRWFSRSVKLCLSSLLVVSGLLAFNGCKKQSDAESGKVTFAFITNTSADFWSYADAGLRKAEQDFGDIRVVFKAGDGTVARQKQIVDDLISSGVKGIAISVIDPAAQTAMINEWSKLVPILCCDSDAVDSNRVAYLGTDNIAAGRKVGELVKKALPDGGKIMVYVGIREMANARERFQGLNEAIAGTNIEVIDLMTDEADFVKAKRNAENTLTSHPDVKAMVGLWEYNPPQILTALEAANKLGQIKVVGFDENFATLRAIDAGNCEGTVVQQPFQFGYQSAKLLRALVVEGKTAAEAGVPEDKLIYVDTRVITPGEGLKYIAECTALLESVK